MGNLQPYHNTTPNPQTGLLLKEKHAVETTWRKFRENYAENGVSLFVDFFSQYPEYKDLFQDLSLESPSSLPTNPRLVAHALSLVYQVTAMIENLDHPSILTALMRKNALRHTRHEGVTPKHFVNLTKVMKSLFHRKFGSTMTPAAITGWERLFTLLLTITSQVFREVATKQRSKSDMSPITPGAGTSP